MAERTPAYKGVVRARVERYMADEAEGTGDYGSSLDGDDEWEDEDDEIDDDDETDHLFEASIPMKPMEA